MLHSIFDCPEQIQTSPTITFSNLISDPDEIVTVYGPPASGVDNEAIHVPELEAFTFISSWFQLAFIDTSTPGYAQPQIGACVLR